MFDQVEIEEILQSSMLSRLSLDNFDVNKVDVYNASIKCKAIDSGSGQCVKLSQASESFFARTGVYANVVIATEKYIEEFKREVGTAFTPSNTPVGKLNIAGRKSRYLFLTSEHWDYEESVLTYMGGDLSRPSTYGFIDPIHTKFYMSL